MVEALFLPSPLDVVWLPEMLLQAARMPMIAAIRASLITMNPFKGPPQNPAAARCGRAWVCVDPTRAPALPSRGNE
jgi:hypothetical protein